MKSTFWIPIAAILVIYLTLYKVYGKSGVKSVSLLVGMLLVNDGVSHFFGKTAEYIFVGFLAAVAIVIYSARRQSKK